MFNLYIFLSSICPVISEESSVFLPERGGDFPRPGRLVRSCRNAAVLGLGLGAFTFASSSSSAQSSLPVPSLSASTPVAAHTIVLTAYGADGTNSGTARLGRNVTIQPSTAGVSGATYLWNLVGAGSLSGAGVYTAPTAMPADNQVTITATLASDATVSTSYQLSLVYAAPTIRWMLPATLMGGKTNNVSITGYDFTPATTIVVNGVVVPSTLQSPGVIAAQIPVNAGASQAVSIAAKNPSPGGGASLAAQVAVQTPTIVLTAYSSDGHNTGLAYLGHSVTLQASVAGISSPTFTWSLAGAGSLSSAGVYTAPAVMSGKTATVTATLVGNTGVTASYAMTLEYEQPAIRWITPTKLLTGATNAVTIVGYDFTPTTTIQVNGVTVPSTFQAPSTMIAQVVVPVAATNTRSFVAKNPTPGGGPSTPVVATLQPVTIQLSSYNDNGLNPTTNPLGGTVQYLAAVQGSGNSTFAWPIHWTVQGGGSISSTGLYRAPAVLPANPTITITATLSNESSVKSSVQLTLQNPAPVVNQSSPTQLAAGKTNTVTLAGSGFQPGTQILLNGSPTATKFLSSSTLSVSIPVSATATNPVSVTAQNPAPGGGVSNAFQLMIASTTVVSATIGSRPGLAIAPDFLGLSHDWNDAQANMGSQATGVNNIYRQLVKNLSNAGSPFMIRVGGGSTDNSVAPTANTVQPFVELAQAMPVKFSLGVNLGASDVQLAKQQAAYFAGKMPASALEAIEIGNEPDLYAQNGRRSSSYGLSNYLSEFSEWQSGIQPLIPNATKVMGAAWASPYYLQQNFVSMEQQQAPNFSLVSQHFYAGHQSSTNTFAPDYLLQPSVVSAYVTALTSAAATAHKNGQLFRVGEMNSIDRSGLLGVSDTFSAALWSIDAMFQYASIGVDGVNWHGTSGCAYCAFTFGVQNVAGKNVYTLQQVNPLYYGLLFFHQATGSSAQFLPVTMSSVPNVKVWATVDKSGTTRIAILKKDESFAGTVAITLPGYGQASVLRLVAPSYQSTAGVALGNQTFDGSIDGLLVGSKANETMEPSNSVYEVSVQPTSAVLLTLTSPD